MKYLTWYLPSAIFAASAGLLAYHGMSGWGWFIFGAVLTYPRSIDIG